MGSHSIYSTKLSVTFDTIPEHTDTFPSSWNCLIFRHSRSRSLYLQIFANSRYHLLIIVERAACKAFRSLFFPACFHFRISCAGPTGRSLTRISILPFSKPLQHFLTSWAIALHFYQLAWLNGGREALKLSHTIKYHATSFRVLLLPIIPVASASF